MHSGFPAGTSYTFQSGVEYALNALRQEVAALTVREVEQVKQMHVNSHMIQQMFTWMTQHGMPLADSNHDV